MVTKAIACPPSLPESTDLLKNGFDAPNNAKQKYLRHACGRRSRENPSPNGYAEERKEEEVLRAYYQEERPGLGGLGRAFGVSPATLIIGRLKKRSRA